MKVLKYFILIAMLSNIILSNNLNWKNFNSALKDAKKSNKIILVDVYTDWCKWCKEMDKNTYSNQAVKKYLNENFVISKLNAEGDETFKYNNKTYSAPEISRAFNVDGYPATVFLTSSGEFITLLPGYVEAPMFLDVLTYIKSGKYKTMEFEKYLKEKK